MGAAVKTFANSPKTTKFAKVFSLESFPLYSIIFLFLRLTGVLGSGEFGTVNKGVWESPMGAMDVAVKQLQPGASEEDKVKFLQEAAINGQFRHPNVVKLMGVVTTGEPVSTLNLS